jgi:putative transposase
VYDGPSRKPLRYSGHDYRAPCRVHVTICTHHRQLLFGTVTATGMHLNDAGRFVAASLRALHSDAHSIAIDTHIVMPDHVHAIIVLGTNPHADATTSIPELVRSVKMRVMKSWPTGVRRRGWASYDTHLWQRSYYDTLIRNDAHLETTRAYILANPARWLERLDSHPDGPIAPHLP